MPSDLQHPSQPLVIDDQGIIRFKRNAIVRTMLDWATPRGFDMNAIAMMTFSDEDRVQFAQLIGYSVGGFSELSYVSDEAYERATVGVDELRATLKE